MLLTVCVQELKLTWQNVTPISKTQLEHEGGGESHGKLSVAGQKERFGGYDCEILEPLTSVPQTDCPICKLILCDPYLTACCCTISFCYSCVERVQADCSRCPICREENFEIFPNIFLKHFLNQLHVLCTYSKDRC